MVKRIIIETSTTNILKDNPELISICISNIDTGEIKYFERTDLSLDRVFEDDISKMIYNTNFFNEVPYSGNNDNNLEEYKNKIPDGTALYKNHDASIIQIISEYFNDLIGLNEEIIVYTTTSESYSLFLRFLGENIVTKLDEKLHIDQPLDILNSTLFMSLSDSSNTMDDTKVKSVYEFHNSILEFREFDESMLYNSLLRSQNSKVIFEKLFK